MIDTEWFCGKGIEDEESRTSCSGAKRIAAMIFICGVGLALLGILGCASAQEKADVPVHVYQDESKVVKLMPGPCVHQGVKDFIGASTPQFAERFKAIESTWQMRDGTRKSFAGCWIELSAEEVGYEAFGLLFEDGERYLVNKAEFLAGGGTAT